ncbi:hypothetical protein K7432_004904 [Basidiobolus ranarum]|uniref:Heat shock 70 kDa protein 12A n=1 Tax=Basidiobolus ranarum TaxID=34480 RepID=A0ABR2WXM2_9FUNG
MLQGPTPDIFREYTGPTTAKCVAAIDFGTSGTGYAFAFPGWDGISDARGSVYTNSPWADGRPGKTKTALLLDENNKFIAFGKAAQTKYRAMAFQNKGRYFEYFKMNLYTDSVNAGLKIKAKNGDQVSATIVFSESLKYIKKSLMDQITKSSGHMDESDIKWILTVPAIWSDAAKQVMKEAAELAGLRGVALQLALEPEAASLWVLQSNDLRVDVGSTYMVCDCGGGTIDVTVHAVDSSQRKVKEAIPATGGDWGSTAIDRRVLALLERIFGQQRYKRMLQDSMGYTKLLEDIESVKISFDIDTDIVLVLPESLASQTPDDELSVEEAVSLYSSNENADFQLLGSNFLIPATYFYKTCMEPTINSTVAHVKGILGRNPGISKIVLVGNFANCRPLQTKFIESFRSVDVIIPNLPGDAIMKGAVLFGANPALVTSRKLRFTYGERVAHVFDESIHPESKAITTKRGTKHCNDIFDRLAIMGEEMAVGEEVSREYYALDDDNTTVGFQIFKVARREVKFTTDFQVKQIGSFTLPCKGSNDRIKYTMIFSSEILVKAENSSGETNQIRLKFNE